MYVLLVTVSLTFNLQNHVYLKKQYNILLIMLTMPSMMQVSSVMSMILISNGDKYLNHSIVVKITSYQSLKKTRHGSLDMIVAIFRSRLTAESCMYTNSFSHMIVLVPLLFFVIKSRFFHT